MILTLPTVPKAAKNSNKQLLLGPNALFQDYGQAPSGLRVQKLGVNAPPPRQLPGPVAAHLTRQHAKLVSEGENFGLESGLGTAADDQNLEW